MTASFSLPVLRLFVFSLCFLLGLPEDPSLPLSSQPPQFLSSLSGSRISVNMRTGVTGRVTHSDGEYSRNMTSWLSLLAPNDS